MYKYLINKYDQSLISQSTFIKQLYAWYEIYTIGDMGKQKIISITSIDLDVIEKTRVHTFLEMKKNKRELVVNDKMHTKTSKMQHEYSVVSTNHYNIMIQVQNILDQVQIFKLMVLNLFTTLNSLLANTHTFIFSLPPSCSSLLSLSLTLSIYLSLPPFLSFLYK